MRLFQFVFHAAVVLNLYSSVITCLLTVLFYFCVKKMASRCLGFFFYKKIFFDVRVILYQVV